MSDDRPTIFMMHDLVEKDEIVLCVTHEEAEVLRDVLARVAGDGSQAKVARRVFEVLEGVLGYDCLEDDGLDGEIVSPDDIHERLPYPLCVDHGCKIHPWVL